MLLFVILYLVCEAAVSSDGWSIEPPLAYVAIAALLYWVGGRGCAPGAHSRWRTASFVAGLVTIVIALDSPIDALRRPAVLGPHAPARAAADGRAAADPARPPVAADVAGAAAASRGRRSGARSRARRWTAPLRALARPLPAWVLFNATIVAWHIPAAYNATLTSSAIHDLEHAMFFFTGLLFWARVIDPGPLRPRLIWPARIAYVVGAMVVGWVLAIALVLVPHPLYPHYATLAHRPGGISALTDQQLAGGVMWVPGSISLHDRDDDRLLPLARAGQRERARAAARSRPEED